MTIGVLRAGGTSGKMAFASSKNDGWSSYHLDPDRHSSSSGLFLVVSDHVTLKMFIDIWPGM
jgi:hypothetical protein